MGQIKVKKIRDQILFYLVHYPHLRDNDEKLIATIWKDKVNHLLNKSCTEISAMEFLQLLADGNLPNPESIRRSRAKLQEQFENLRGEKYEKRQIEQNNIKKDLNEFNGETD